MVTVGMGWKTSQVRRAGEVCALGWNERAAPFARGRNERMAADNIIRADKTQQLRADMTRACMNKRL